MVLIKNMRRKKKHKNANFLSVLKSSQYLSEGAIIALTDISVSEMINPPGVAGAAALWNESLGKGESP